MTCRIHSVIVGHEMLAHLTLTQLKVGLRDLAANRWDDVERSASGRFHALALRRQLERIESLPAVLTGAAPLAAELDAADEVHDGFGAAIYYATEVAFCLPDAAPELTAAARRIRDGLIPNLEELRAPYFVEADRADARRPLLDQLATDLKAFQVTGQGTLFDVAVKFLDAGALLQELLSQRPDTMHLSHRKALLLRAETAALLDRFREDLRLEKDRDPSVPIDLEHRVFANFDSMLASAGPSRAKQH